MPKRRRKKKKPQKKTLAEQPLWFWGMVFIFGGLAANFFVPMVMDFDSLRGAEKRGAEFGRGLASAIFILSGIGIVVYDLVLKKK